MMFKTIADGKEIIENWEAELEKLEKYINNNKDVFERLKNK